MVHGKGNINCTLGERFGKCTHIQIESLLGVSCLVSHIYTNKITFLLSAGTTAKSSKVRCSFSVMSSVSNRPPLANTGSYRKQEQTHHLML